MVPHTLSVSPPPAREQGATVQLGPARRGFHPALAGKTQKETLTGVRRVLPLPAGLRE